MAKRALFPMRYLNVSQGYGTSGHKGGYPIDLAGKDSGIDNVYAPFDCRVKKIYNYGHTVWIQSRYKVKWANGDVNYATISFTHDNNVSNLKVGQRLKRGQKFYQEGTAGNATGNHVHMETARGKFVNPGWYKTKYGTWRIYNAVKPQSLLWLHETKVIKTGGYKWRRCH